jgi:hypothetical protein
VSEPCGRRDRRRRRSRPSPRARRRPQVADDRAVCKALSQEFPRHLDLQDPLPRGPEAAHAAAHAGGYGSTRPTTSRACARSCASSATSFLPLRVIRRELAAGRSERGARRPRAAAPDARPGAALRRLTFSLPTAARCTRSRTWSRRRRRPGWWPSSRTRDRRGRAAGRTRYYDETEREIIRAVTELSRYGVAGRNLRVFKTSAERESGAAAADPRPVAALAQSRAAQGGRRGAREPRRGRLAPQAPAARARPAPDRQVTEPTCGADPRHPGLPEAGDRVQGHHAAAARPSAVAAAVASWPTGRGRARSTTWSRPRRAGSSSAPRWRASSAPASSRPQARQAAARHGLGRVHPRVRRRRAGDARRRARRRRAVLLHDDLLATGGTARALAELARGPGAGRSRAARSSSSSPSRRAASRSRATTCTR